MKLKLAVNTLLSILSYSHLFLKNLGSWHKVCWSAFEIRCISCVPD